MNELQQVSNQPAKPATTTTPTTTRKQPKQALSPTPMKPCSTQKTAEKAQIQAPTSPQNPKRNPHKIGKLTVNQTKTKMNKPTKAEKRQYTTWAILYRYTYETKTIRR